MESAYQAPQSELEIQSDEKPRLVDATRGVRLVAALVDGIIIYAIIFAIFAAFGFSQALMGESSGFDWSVFDENEIMFQVFAGFGAVAAYLILNFHLLNNYGQTIGKKLMSIKIVKPDGTKPNMTDLIVKRYLALVVLQFIPVVGGLISLLNVLLIFRSSKRCLHDDIADTKVVDC